MDDPNLVKAALDGLVEVFLENDADFDDSFILDLVAPFEFENEIEPVSPEVFRELAATAARDAQVALRRLAAAGIA